MGTRIALVESNNIVEEGGLECSVEFTTVKTFESGRLNAVDEFSVVVTVIGPFVLPEEGFGASGPALRGPVVVHVVKKCRIFLDDGDVEVTISSGSFSAGPQTMDGEGLAEW